MATAGSSAGRHPYLKDIPHNAHHLQHVGGPHSPHDTVGSRDTARSPITAPVPEDGVLDITPPPRKRSGLGSFLRCTCFAAQPAEAEMPGSPVSTSGPSNVQRNASSMSSPTRRGSSMVGVPSRRTSSVRRFMTLKRMGTSAYSDADWFDAASQFGGHDEHEQMLAEVDQLVKELGDFKGPWIPDPPLAFAVPNMQFIRLPERTGFAGWWERDDDRTTPPPQPIDVMLKASWIVQKSHNSIPGVWMEETDKNLVMTVKPRFVPPGFPRYVETYDKSNETEPSWALRRDLKTGRSYGKIYMTADGTLVFRVWTRPMFSNEVDIITEEYMRLEDNGQVLVARQCCLDVKSGKRAVQYLVGRHWDQPPKGSL